jgi:hypothetical protein
MANSSRWLTPFKVDGILYDQRRASLAPSDLDDGTMWTNNYGATIPLMDLREDEHASDDCIVCGPITRGVVWKKVIDGHVPCNG